MNPYFLKASLVARIAPLSNPYSKILVVLRSKQVLLLLSLLKNVPSLF